MARAGTLPSYLYQREIQPGEPVSLERSDLEEQQEKSGQQDEGEDGMLKYDSPKQWWRIGQRRDRMWRWRDSIFRTRGEFSPRKSVSLLKKYLLQQQNFCFVNFSLFSLLWNYAIAVTFCFFYAFVDIAICFFNADLSLLIRFSVIEVKQKKVVTVTSLRYSCET